MHRIKKLNVLIYGVLFLLLSFGGKWASLLTDYYWFQEIHAVPVFTKILITQFSLGLIVSAAFLTFFLLNIYIARRYSKRPFIVIEPYARIAAPPPLPNLGLFKPILQLLAIFAVLIIAFLIGQWASSHWEILLKFNNGVPFRSNDPLFGRDIGFYVFKLPFYRFVYHCLFGTTFFTFLLVSSYYFFHQRILLTSRGFSISQETRVHLTILLGLLAVLLAFHFQFRIFDLLTLQRSLVPGAGYADIKAFLPWLKILRFAALFAAIAIWSSLWLKQKHYVWGTVGVLSVAAIFARFHTGIVQKFEVSPNEIVKEMPYLKFAIENTRQSYGLNDVHELEFNPVENLTPALLKKNDVTLNNIRLWEHKPLLTSYGQLQEIRTYYDFLDADNDRYTINGQYRQVMISARELVSESLPSRIWINERLTYTHGYGICLGPVNRISPEGLPEFFIKDIPPVSSVNMEVKVPQIYYGESNAGYIIVNARSNEFDYPAGDENIYTNYSGIGGIPVKNFFRKLLFAWKFGEIKILLSGDITAESRILYHRSLQERLAKAVPFLKFDTDPYIVISRQGELFWIADGYTITNQYPYAEKLAGFNYIRNSVKAVIDAYHGTMNFYISDPNDPIVQTYAKIFPNVFQSLDQMPDDLRSHIRYPQTLLDVQARIYATYHMTDPRVFYNKEDLWKIPSRTLGGRSQPMEPYYTIMKLAGVGQREEFILMIPFTPAKKENMIAWMAARCDEPNYGKLLVYNFPKQKLVYGPQQIESRIDQDADISKQLTLWDQGGSRVLRGSLHVIPVEQSLLYVQPLYLEATVGGLPELKRIIVAYGNTIAMEENLELSLQRIFTGRADYGAIQDQIKSSITPEKDLKNLIQQIKQHFDKAQRALRQGNWPIYGEEMKNVEKLLQKP